MKITRFIAHVIDHRSSTLALSDVETPVNSSFPHDFFAQYILHALGHELRRRACFGSKNGRVHQAFRRLLADPSQFVPASKEMAGYLYQAMCQGPFSRLIHPGDIMFALVSEGNSQSLAILKIDPSEALIRHLVMTPAGPQVLFEQRDSRLPTVKEETVQKIAVLFDQRHAAPEPHDLIILDNNIKETKVARFFWDGFLGSQLNRDGRDMASLFNSRPKRFASKQPLTVGEKRRFVNAVEDTLRQGRPLSARTLATKAVQATGRVGAEAAKLENALVRDVISYGRRDERITEAEIVPVDGDVAAALSQMRTYVLDGEIQVTGPTAALEDKRRVKIVQSPGGQITLTIEATSLEIR
jgi:hypothetical protein